MIHKPVLLNEVLENLDLKPGKKYIDGTLNGGGHTRAILEKIKTEGKILGIELDVEIYKHAVLALKKESNITIVNDSYVNLKKIAEREGFLNSDGILFDFGMSSWHIEESGKGFSFLRDEPLDMRYHKEGLTAADIVNGYSQDNLEYIFSEYGGEVFANRIAVNIVKTRKRQLIERTNHLVDIIKGSVPFWYRMRRIHFATKTFQALRIEVNRELDSVGKGLDAAFEVAAVGGRILAISFHSLEDKILKERFKSWEVEDKGEALTKKPIGPTQLEIRDNPRSRSAKLRVFKKLK